MSATESAKQTKQSRARLLVMLGAGILAATASGVFLGWQYAPTIGWAVACIIYMAWVWGTIARLDDKTTAQRARVEDPTSTISELLTIIASVLSLGAVVVLILVAKDSHGITKVLVPAGPAAGARERRAVVGARAHTLHAALCATVLRGSGRRHRLQQ